MWRRGSMNHMAETGTARSGERESGTIVRINGPIVQAAGMRSRSMQEVVEVGEFRLIGEIIRLADDMATIQVYENTSGIKPGEPVYGTGRPLSVTLGPGIIGNIYDGIQRPLANIAEQSGFYIGRGQKPDPLDQQAEWEFEPRCEKGQKLEEGAIYGVVPETAVVEHRLLVPHGVHGTVSRVAEKGRCRLKDVVLTLDTPGGQRDLTLSHQWSVRRQRPLAARRRAETPLITGLRVIDTFFPVASGGTAAIPGGFGTGKTMTQHALAKWSAAEVIVYIGCGERGNEMTEVLREFPELVDPRTGRSLMERTILIANTSNMPVAAREVSIYTGITFAEYYRDMGYDVAVMADSTSRWAEALRELSGRLEEMPADEGFPAYLPTRLAEFYERAGGVETLSGRKGSVTIIGAVSPPGGDFSEPVTQHTSRFIRCFWALDRQLANARHYPAISWLNSYSEYIPEIQPWWEERHVDWKPQREELMTVLQEEVSLQRIARLVGADALPDHQRLILFLADIIKNAYLQQNSFDEVDMYCAPEKQVWMMRVLLRLKERSQRWIRAQGTLAEIRELPCINRLIRMKSTIRNEDTDQFQQLHDRLDAEFDELERRAT